MFSLVPFAFLVQTGFRDVGQAGLTFLTSVDQKTGEVRKRTLGEAGKKPRTAVARPGVFICTEILLFI